MKKIKTITDCAFVQTIEEAAKIDVSRGGANGLPNAEFAVFPLVGQLTFKIGKDTFTPAAVATGFINKKGEFELRMVSVNSFNRTARENPEDDTTTVKLLEGINALGMKPSDIAIELKDKTVEITDNEVKFYFPKLEAGKQADWSKEVVSQRTVSTRQVQDNSTLYAELKEGFKKYITENDLVDCVNAIDASFLA